ncbi:MAG TPA: YdjY domain-containing protein [Pirellulales bacterium]|jgi:hypothetical protein|nr:YdjY domain-containing protein [Pirellulales bacterium]
MLRNLRRVAWLCGLALLVNVEFAQADEAGKFKIDKDKKTITIPCKIAPRKLAKYDQIYPIEVIACYPDPKGVKAHETVVTIDCKPSDIHKALVDLGLRPGKPAKGENASAVGPEVKIALDVGGRLIPIEKCLVDKKTNKTLPSLKWLFTGSAMKQLDPNDASPSYAADSGGTLISVFPVTDETVFQTNLTMKDEPVLKMETNKAVLPKEGEPVKLIISVP